MNQKILLLDSKGERHTLLSGVPRGGGGQGAQFVGANFKSGAMKGPAFPMH